MKTLLRSRKNQGRWKRNAIWLGQAANLEGDIKGPLDQVDAYSR